MHVDQEKALIRPAGIRVIHKVKWGRFALKPHQVVEVRYVLWGGYDRVGFGLVSSTHIYLEPEGESWNVIEHKGEVYNP